MQRQTNPQPTDDFGRATVASAREGAPSGRLAGFFPGRALRRKVKETAMEPVLNPLMFDHSEQLAPSPPERATPKAPRVKTSRAAEYIAALYIALLVCTPWLVRDASFFRPPSTGIEMHLSKAAPTQVEALTRPSQAVR
jgi:hypothetical protein